MPDHTFETNIVKKWKTKKKYIISKTGKKAGMFF